MNKFNIANMIAVEMDKAINSEENKALFSTASTIEKLAFKRVSDEDQETEMEKEFMKVAAKKSCKCEDKKGHKVKSCDCDCHEEATKTTKTTKTTKSSSPLSDAFNALIKISAALDAVGFEKSATDALVLANEIVKEAKAKKDKKSKTKSDDKKSKMPMKDRMKKMREMKDQGSKKSTEKTKSSPAKSSDKSSKKK